MFVSLIMFYVTSLLGLCMAKRKICANSSIAWIMAWLPLRWCTSKLARPLSEEHFSAGMQHGRDMFSAH